MAFDFKKEYKEFYGAKTTPTIVTIPKMNFLAVRGSGDPNEEDGEYHRAIKHLYPVAYTLRMSDKGDYKIEGFFEYVVPPLEGFWWQPNIKGVDATNKSTFEWISLLRLPDFVTKEDVDWAIQTASKKKGEDFSDVTFFTYEEGLCVQCLHLGSYDDEMETTSRMETYLQEKGYLLDITDERYHHEIYLSHPNKTEVSKRKTIIRHPIRDV